MEPVSNLIQHDDIVTRDPATGNRTQISVPNARVLIYSDGEHNTGDPLINPFASQSPSLLMTAFP